MSALQKRVLQSGLPPRPPISIGRGGLSNARRKKDYSAIHWSEHFDEKRHIKLDNGDTFCVYVGGVKQNSTESPIASDNTLPVIVLLHGGGFSGLTWAQLNTHLSQSVECRTFALDLRGHGETILQNLEDESDLSAARLADDVLRVVDKLLGNTSPPVVLVGHSMGGALAVHTALQNCSSLATTEESERSPQNYDDAVTIQNLVGVCVIDVVEGTAMDALSSMQSFLRSRPKSFPSLDYAIEWAVRSGQVRNIDSARVSMPGQLKNATTGGCSSNDVKAQKVNLEHIDSGETSNPGPKICDVIAEEPEDDNHMRSEELQKTGEAQKTFKDPQDKINDSLSNTPTYTWRVDLCKSEPHWKSWFEGLSSKFLSVSASKLLVLAGVDRLDKDLTVGQMQGKFQMQILPQAGHAVHEDVPDKVSNILSTFLVRNKFARPLDNFNQTFPAC